MNSAAFAFVISAIISILVGPWIIKKIAGAKFNQTINEDAPERHHKKQGTPTMGGIIIFVGFLITVLVMHRIDSRAMAVILLMLASALIGFIDDYLIAKRGRNLGLKARQKLVAQFIIALIFMVWVFFAGNYNTTRVYIGRGAVLQLGWLYYPLAVLMLVGMSNAFNLTDGLDGLASGLTSILSIGLGCLVMSVNDSNPALTILCWSLGGACLGFVWHNCNPAKIFMGDTGSLALGAATAGVSIVGKCEFLYLLLALIFLIEAVSVMIQVVSYKVTGKRVFKMTPIHHHYELSGVSETQIVTRAWLIQVILVVIVLMLAGVFHIWR